MNFWRKKGSPIPPVEETSSLRPRATNLPPHSPSSSTTYVAGRTSPLPPDLHSSSTTRVGRDNVLRKTAPSRDDFQPSDDNPQDRYHPQRGVGSVYSRGQGDLDRDRDALFAGLKLGDSGSGHGQTAERGTPPAEEEDEDDVEGIKQRMRTLKQETKQSTGNALRIARQAEETAAATIGKLGTQSEAIADIEHKIDKSHGHTQKANDKVAELKQLNRSIFRPVITFNKDKKRAQREAEDLERHKEMQNALARQALDVRETHERMAQVGSFVSKTDDQPRAANSRYMFDADEADEDAELQINDDLDEIAGVTKRLKFLARQMGEEVDKQNTRLIRVADKAENVEYRVHGVTAKLNRIS